MKLSKMIIIKICQNDLSTYKKNVFYHIIMVSSISNFIMNSNSNL